MGEGRHDLTPASGWQIGKERRGKLASDVGEGVAVEE